MTFNKIIYNKINNLITDKYPKAKLMIVSKNRSTFSIREALNEGALLFGENKVQEADAKFEELRAEFSNINLHLIGPLQTNKVKQALKIFDVIQSVDREKLVKEIAKNLTASTRTTNFYIQVNIGREDQKSGVDPDSTNIFYDYAKGQGLNIIGLMCLPPNNEDPDFFFKKMIELRNKINPDLLLSMGMSGDYLAALENKTDLVRIGSKFFTDE
ncbi:YggS family pyridoxal phosphate-dependent enzyme [Alphaproteobacteria bacterium]|jgi:PLP dependent protein|nr:YggS family pyridoxal phosphate-dependent enzyme [Alphaproteobacteria bacterium]